MFLHIRSKCADISKRCNEKIIKLNDIIELDIGYRADRDQYAVLIETSDKRYVEVYDTLQDAKERTVFIMGLIDKQTCKHTHEQIVDKFDYMAGTKPDNKNPEQGAHPRSAVNQDLLDTLRKMCSEDANQ